MLCANGEAQFCSNIEVGIAPVDDEVDGNARFFFNNKPKGPNAPTTTVATAAHTLFDRLITKVAFVVCKLRLWCPDHDKAFTTITMGKTPKKGMGMRKGPKMGGKVNPPENVNPPMNA